MKIKVCYILTDGSEIYRTYRNYVEFEQDKLNIMETKEVAYIMTYEE